MNWELVPILVVIVLVGLFWPAFARWHRARKRAIDVQLLWPICVEKAPDMDHAKAAFALHVLHDSAWTKDFTERELIAYIDRIDQMT